MGPRMDTILGPKIEQIFPKGGQEGFWRLPRWHTRRRERGPKMDPKKDRPKIMRIAKTGQPTTLDGAVPGNGKSANARKKLSKVKDDSPKGRVSGRGRRPGPKVHGEAAQ